MSSVGSGDQTCGLRPGPGSLHPPTGLGLGAHIVTALSTEATPSRGQPRRAFRPAREDARAAPAGPQPIARAVKSGVRLGRRAGVRNHQVSPQVRAGADCGPDAGWPSRCASTAGYPRSSSRRSGAGRLRAATSWRDHPARRSRGSLRRQRQHHRPTTRSTIENDSHYAHAFPWQTSCQQFPVVGGFLGLRRQVSSASARNGARRRPGCPDRTPSGVGSVCAAAAGRPRRETCFPSGDCRLGTRSPRSPTPCVRPRDFGNHVVDGHPLAAVPPAILACEGVALEDVLLVERQRRRDRLSHKMLEPNDRREWGRWWRETASRGQCLRSARLCRQTAKPPPFERCRAAAARRSGSG